MLKVEKIKTTNWEAAIRGMRNAYNSWERSDSQLCQDSRGFEDCAVSTMGKCPREDDDFSEPMYCIGKEDMKLCKKLIAGGSVHRKFLRHIIISMDITAPLYWWKEMDTYRFKECNSCSTMHTVTKKEFTPEDFSWERVSGLHSSMTRAMLLDDLNQNRQAYIDTKNRQFWDNIIQQLPSSYNQKRTITTNYETAMQIIQWRENHKLPEWHTLVDALKKLPYMMEFIEATAPGWHDLRDDPDTLPDEYEVVEVWLACDTIDIAIYTKEHGFRPWYSSYFEDCTPEWKHEVIGWKKIVPFRRMTDDNRKRLLDM